MPVSGASLSILTPDTPGVGGKGVSRGMRMVAAGLACLLRALVDAQVAGFPVSGIRHGLEILKRQSRQAFSAPSRARHTCRRKKWMCL